MSPSECRAKAAQVRMIVAGQPDFAETAERIARAWEKAALEAEGVGRSPGPDSSSAEQVGATAD